MLTSLGIKTNSSEKICIFLFHPDCPVFQADHLPTNPCLAVTSDI